MEDGWFTRNVLNHTEDISALTCTSSLSCHQVLVKQSLALSLDTTLVSEANMAAEDGN